MYLQKIRQKDNKQGQKKIPKKILEKEITQIGSPKTASYLDTRDQDKIKLIISFYLQKMTQKNNKQNIKLVPKKLSDKEINQIN